MDFTLSNARPFYSSKGDPLGVKGLINHDVCILLFPLLSLLFYRDEPR